MSKTKVNAPCRIDGCPLDYTTKSAYGLCSRHYARLRRTGSVEVTLYSQPDLTPAERIHDRLEPLGDCLVWTGGLSTDGYGSCTSDIYPSSRVHRTVWIWANGPVPDGFELDHTCHTRDPLCASRECQHRRCANPEHLELVTHWENCIRGNSGPNRRHMRAA